MTEKEETLTEKGIFDSQFDRMTETTRLEKGISGGSVGEPSIRLSSGPAVSKDMPLDHESEGVHESKIAREVRAVDMGLTDLESEMTRELTTVQEEIADLQSQMDSDIEHVSDTMLDIETSVSELESKAAQNDEKISELRDYIRKYIFLPITMGSAIVGGLLTVGFIIQGMISALPALVLCLLGIWVSYKIIYGS